MKIELNNQQYLVVAATEDRISYKCETISIRVKLAQRLIKKLGDTVTIKGGAHGGSFTDNNIGAVSDGSIKCEIS